MNPLFHGKTLHIKINPFFSKFTEFRWLYDLLIRIFFAGERRGTSTSSGTLQHTSQCYQWLAQAKSRFLSATKVSWSVTLFQSWIAHALSFSCVAAILKYWFASWSIELLALIFYSRYPKNDKKNMAYKAGGAGGKVQKVMVQPIVSFKPYFWLKSMCIMCRIADCSHAEL